MRTLALAKFLSAFALFVFCLLIDAKRTHAQEPTDIERNFGPAITRDLSGTYNSMELTDDTSISFAGTLTLKYVKSHTTQRISTFKRYELTSTYSTGSYTGIAIDDGSRIYFTEMDKPQKRNYIVLLGKLVLSNQDLASVVNYYENNRNAKAGQYFDWKGGSPWYGYVEPETDAFGYLFHIEGTWSEFSLGKCGGFPLVMNDTGRYRILDLQDNGKHRKRKQKEKNWGAAYINDEDDSWVAEPHGETIYLSSVRYYDKGKATWDYYGNGIMMAHPKTGDSVLYAMLGGSQSSTYGYVDETASGFEGVWAVIDGKGVGKVLWTRQGTPATEEKK